MPLFQEFQKSCAGPGAIMPDQAPATKTTILSNYEKSIWEKKLLGSDVIKNHKNYLQAKF